MVTAPDKRVCLGCIKPFDPADSSGQPFFCADCYRTITTMVRVNRQKRWLEYASRDSWRKPSDGQRPDDPWPPGFDPTPLS